MVWSGLSRLNIHAFILQRQFSLFNFSSTKAFFSFGSSFILQLLMLLRINGDYLFLAGSLNRIFVLLVSQYLATVFIRSISGTLSNMIELSPITGNGFSSITDVWQGSAFTSDHNTVTLSNQNSIQNMFFLKKDLQKIYICTNIHYG